MEAFLDKKGRLFIGHAGKMKHQLCVNNDSRYCNDNCPAFREPYEEPANGHGEKNYTGRIGLRLCQQVGTLYFDEIEDQRGK